MEHISVVDKSKTKIWAKTDGNPCNVGTGNMPLEEPVPTHPARPGENIIEPKGDANAQICLGSDRNPLAVPRNVKPHGSSEDPNNPESNKSSVSGFSDHQGSGAIRLVVGRGAPFSIEKLSNGIYPEGLPPLYCTVRPDSLATEKIADGKNHPGYALDAAQIYMSQMCQIDDYFKIKKPKIEIKPGKITTSMKDDNTPCSAIILKADKLRLHSRKDIYIVAGGDVGTTHDSNNNAITESGRINLLVKNGQDPSVRNPTPAVRFSQLSACLEAIIKQIEGLAQVVNTHLKTQKKQNATLANAIYGTAVGMSTKNPICQAYNQIGDVSDAKCLVDLHAMLTANFNFIKLNYLGPEGDQSIASRFVHLQ